MIRNASLVDIDKIRKLERNYYNDHSISERILVKWIKKGNFFVIEEDSNIVGSIYFEFLDEVKDLPWEHDPIMVKSGKYIYISEIAVDSKERLPVLFEKVLEFAKDCEGIIWLTGEKSERDQIEQEFLKKNKFKRYKHIAYWECAPDRFVNDHTLYIKKSEVIAGGDGNEYFVHSSGVEEGNTLKEEDKVEFKVVKSDKGPKAENVKKVE